MVFVVVVWWGGVYLGRGETSRTKPDSYFMKNKIFHIKKEEVPRSIMRQLQLLGQLDVFQWVPMSPRDGT